MQKVEGSSPFIRFEFKPFRSGDAGNRAQSCPKQTAPGPALVEVEVGEGSFLNEVFDRGSRAVRRSPDPEGSGPLEANPSPSSSRCLHGKRCRFPGSCERRYAKSSGDERGSGLRTAVSASTPVRPWEL